MVTDDRPNDRSWEPVTLDRVWDWFARKFRASEQPTTRKYGSRTVQQQNVVDVEVDGTGQVVAVYFRAQMLPFKQHFVSRARADVQLEKSKTAPRLIAVEVVDHV